MSSIKEKKIKGNSNFTSLDKLKDFLEVLEKCVCKIITNSGSGSGFFCKLNIGEFNSIQRPFLMTNNHVINANYLNSQNFIKIEINKKEKILNLNERIKITDPQKDFTVIEIKHYDKIFDFLEVSPYILDTNHKETLIDKDIIIPQFPGGIELSVAFGSISKFDANNIYYTVSTDYGSSGSPILLLDNLTIVGLHKQRELSSNENSGTFILNILQCIEENRNLKNINML